MAFRADEEREKGYEKALNYLTPKQGTPKQKEDARHKIIDIIEEYGPVIDSYPTWHPIVSRFPRDDYKYAYTDPSLLRSYYKGLDHTVLLAHGFISCPYQGADQLIKEINNSYNIYKYHDTSEIFKKISN